MGSSKLDPNAFWCLNDPNLNYYTIKNSYINTNSDIKLQHKITGQDLGICCYNEYHQNKNQHEYEYHKSPSSNHTEGNYTNYAFN
jgi:hypothetical protein